MAGMTGGNSAEGQTGMFIHLFELNGAEIKVITKQIRSVEYDGSYIYYWGTPGRGGEVTFWEVGQVGATVMDLPFIVCNEQGLYRPFEGY